MNTELVGRQLKDERIRQGLSMREVARRAEVSIGTIQRLEAGGSYDWMYGKVAAVLGLEIESQEQSA